MSAVRAIDSANDMVCIGGFICRMEFKPILVNVSNFDIGFTDTRKPVGPFGPTGIHSGLVGELEFNP